MQAIVLAAGMGKRLKELTNDATKCMVKVNNVTMIERMLSSLDKRNLERIVIVVGYKAEKLVDFIQTLSIQTPICFVENKIYNKTNNIYSLYLAKDYLLEDDTLLLESDLVFEEAVLDRILENPYPSLALVSKYESWMDGTVVEIDDEGNILRFRSKKEFKFKKTENYYKTVNIYKFSKEFSKTHYVPFLEAYCKALGNNEYYEQVLKVITLLDKPEIKAVCLTNESWYEIDDVQDLDIAESIFADESDKLKKMQSRFGGYWRYPHLIDFCYLVNPFYPCKKLMEEIKANFEELLTNYPSGMRVNSLLAAKLFGLHQENIVVGNGAAELIKSLMSRLNGKIGVIFPTFEEYPNRCEKEDLIPFIPQNDTFPYTAHDLISFYSDNKVDILTLINPDNPSGNYIEKNDVLRLAKWAEEYNVRLIVDESFVDFCDKESSPSLLSNEILHEYPHLIVVKSISKSYGVPGLRLGILASDDEALIAFLKKDVAIWNINSFGEFYMQIAEKYQSDYLEALERFYKARYHYIESLRKISGLRVIDSQANYLMCEILPPHSSSEVTQRLLTQFNILIKDLSNKRGIDGRQYIRIAVKRPKENDLLVNALTEILKD